MIRAWLAAAVCAVIWCVPSPSAAQVARFAVIIGNNAGARDDVELRYAEADATKVSNALEDLGGFLAENIVLLRGRNADSVRDALIAVNQRIRAHAGGQAVLVVYYSGHADATALHLGTSRLEISQLQQFVGGSSATFRLLILDSCRSGALTRVKGGRPVAPIAIGIEERLDGEGAVVLTSSTANEDSQESDELKGSFFTHYLVSGLHGAADSDGDARVTLGEAYRYAYEHTLRASSRTIAGLQHPTFQYQLRGQDDIALTMLDRYAGARGTLIVPPKRAYLIFVSTRDGPVAVEIGANDVNRRLCVKAGRYFVVGRGPDHVLEGSISVKAGEQLDLADVRLRRIAYARLVRKGHATLDHVHGLEAGFRLRTPLWSGASACYGAFAGYSIDLQHVTIASRIGFCRSTLENDVLRDRMDEADLEIRALHAWDFLRRFTAYIGVTAGAAYLRRTFETEGVAPDRSAPAGYLGAGVGVSAELAGGFILSLDSNGSTYLFNEQSSMTGKISLRTTFTVRTAIAIGKQF